MLGSGPIRIGQGIEFDYCSVHSVWAFKRLGYETIIVNNNPETVSTDFDVADKLYFEPLTAEDVQNIVEQEKPWGAVVQFGGQTAIKLAKALTEMGVQILGTSADGVDAAEDRERFDEILQKCGIPRAKGRTVFTTQEALQAANELGYPVLVRPSYVLGGQGMEIAYTDRNIEDFMKIINMTVQEHPILIDKYLMGRELEVDGVFDGEDILIPGIMEHVERAGVHSGDSIAVYPPINLEDKHRELILKHTKNMAKHLNVIGLINAQYILYNDDIYVIEVNPRSSRTIPYISKVTGVPIIDLATKVMLGQKLKDLGYGTGIYKEADYYAVKAPVFSFEKLTDVDTGLGPEMKSTGEVLGLAETYPQALLKAFKGAGLRVPKRGSRIIVTVKDEDKPEMVGIARGFEEMGIEIYATSGTCDALTEAGIAVQAGQPRLPGPPQHSGYDPERHRGPDHQHSHQGPQARQRRLQDPPLRRGALRGLRHRHRHRPGRPHRPGAEPQRGPDPHRHHQDLNPNTSGRGYFPSPAVFSGYEKTTPSGVVLQKMYAHRSLADTSLHS